MKPVPPSVHALLYALALLAVSGLHGGCHRAEEAPAAAPVDTLSWILQVSRTSRLYTTEYQIHKIVTHDDIVRLEGSAFSRKFSVRVPLGDRKMALPLDVTLKAYIDFAGFSEQNIRRQGERILITLPDPRVAVTASKIDHRQVKQYIDLTRTRYSDAELADFARQGVQSVLAAVPEMGVLESARLGAARLLVPLLRELGYREENIVIAFRKDFNTDDVPQLLAPESARTL